MKDKVKEITHLFHNYHCLHRNAIDKRFRENGLYFGQPPILKYLSTNKNATQKEIADYLHVSAPSVATSVRRMEESGLIMRDADKTDARRNNLRLTEKGRKLSEFADKSFELVNETAFEGFTDEEFDNMIHYLERMYDNIKAFSEKGGQDV